jgi:thymidine kinase
VIITEAVLLDAAQGERRAGIVSFRNGAKPEVTMLEFYEPGAAIIENSVANAVARATKTNRSALDFIFGAQKMMLEEIAFISNEMLDRTRTEMHLFSEIASKVAGAHSVKDMKAMCEECGQHQIDFIRRDSERLFKHGERLIEATSKLLANPPPN